MIARRAFARSFYSSVSAVRPSSSSFRIFSGCTFSGIDAVIERHVRAHYSIPPNVQLTIGPLRASEFANFDALTVTFTSTGKKQEFEFLLSRDHKSLVWLTKMDLAADPYADIMRKIDVTGRPTRGNKEAKVTVVNYDDFECPFCSRMHTTLFHPSGDGIAFFSSTRTIHWRKFIRGRFMRR